MTNILLPPTPTNIRKHTHSIPNRQQRIKTTHYLIPIREKRLLYTIWSSTQIPPRPLGIQIKILLILYRNPMNSTIRILYLKLPTVKLLRIQRLPCSIPKPHHRLLYLTQPPHPHHKTQLTPRTTYHHQPTPTRKTTRNTPPYSSIPINNIILVHRLLVIITLIYHRHKYIKTYKKRLTTVPRYNIQILRKIHLTPNPIVRSKLCKYPTLTSLPNPRTYLPKYHIPSIPLTHTHQHKIYTSLTTLPIIILRTK
ncbi:MAG: hypothetical protein BWY29_01029 [Microgenomates group bacterium ADurb.Bin238]|nr:MAG: hypothetical protein BWY29_01029 [Microgenomates group bacterium ADurb.Bin238]